MKRTPRLTDEMLDDVEQAARGYAERSPTTGRRFRPEVRAAIARIDQAPELFPTAMHRIRRALLHRFPDGLYLTVGSAEVVVIACMHQRRHPHRWRSRT